MSRHVTAWCACAWLLAAASATAQDAPPSPISVRWNVEIIGAGRSVVPADSRVNPGNRVVEIPETIGMLDVRGNLRLEAGPRLSVIVRPRVRATLERVTPSGRPASSARDADAQFAEAFATWRPLDALAVSYGLQNFQWGPAELISPSNRVFHETGLFRDPLYSVRGRHLLRANVSVGRQWSLIALADLSHNGAGADEAFQAGLPFTRQALVKLEAASADGGSYAGITGGVIEGARGWFGEYGTWMLSDAVSVYVDASHARGSGTWYPVRGPEGRPGFDMPLRDHAGWMTMAVAGVRYTMARGDEWRVEYFHQGAGYSASQLRDAVSTVLLAGDRRQFERFLSPGLEFLGRDLVLVSLRAPDLPPARRLNAQVRYLASITDGSGVAFGNLTANTTDALVAFATLAVTHGPQAAEFSRLVRASVTAGVVYSF